MDILIVSYYEVTYIHGNPREGQ